MTSNCNIPRPIGEFKIHYDSSNKYSAHTLISTLISHVEDIITSINCNHFFCSGVKLGKLYVNLNNLGEQLLEERAKIIAEKLYEDDENEDGDLPEEEEYEEYENRIEELENKIFDMNHENINKQAKFEKEELELKKLKSVVFELQDFLISSIRKRKIKKSELQNVVQLLKKTGVQDCDIKILGFVDPYEESNDDSAA